MTQRSGPFGLAVALLCVALEPGAGRGQPAQTADEVPATVAAWFDVLYDVVRTERRSAPVAARTYGMAAVALYEALVLGSGTHQPLAGQLNGWSLGMDHPLAAAVRALLPPEVVRAREPPGTAAARAFLSRLLDWRSVANSARARVVQGIFPSLSLGSMAAITALERAFTAEGRARVPGPVYTLSVVWGRMVAEAVLAWAATDGSATLTNCPYTPPVGPGLWEPTPPPSRRPWSPAGASCTPWCWPPVRSVRRRPRRPTRKIRPRSSSQAPWRSTPPTRTSRRSSAPSRATGRTSRGPRARRRATGSPS